MDSSSGDSIPPEQQITAVDLSVLVSFLKSFVPSALEDNNELHPSFVKLLDDPVTLDKIKKFITDVQCKQLLIQRASVKGKFIYFYSYSNFIVSHPFHTYTDTYLFNYIFILQKKKMMLMQMKM